MPVEIFQHYGEDFDSSGHLLLVRLTGKGQDFRNRLIEKLAQAQIAANVHYKPLPLLTAYQNLGFDFRDFPNAMALFENEITLPLHTCLTDEQVEYVIQNFCRCYRELEEAQAGR